MEELLLAATLKQQLDALRPIDPEQEKKVMQKFRLDWNYHSNNLEGNSLTYGETKALLFFGVTAHGKPLKDHFEVTGHNEAINMVIDVVNGDYPLNQNFIRELHTLLLKKPYQVDAQTPDAQPTKKWVKVGEYKSSPNHVKTKTGEMFYFATPEETPSKMADLIDWYNERIEAADLNPILLAAEFHYKFIRIHPFDDGNGRTARILMNFILMKFGYPPVIIKTEDKENYFAALRLADVGEIEAFVNYIAINLVRSLEIMLAGALGESIEEPDDIDKEIALLEKRLNGFGDKIEKEKSYDTIVDIFDKSVVKLAGSIELKLEKFQNYYTNFIVNLIIYGKSDYYKGVDIVREDPNSINEIKIFINLNTIKNKGLENFRFIYSIEFVFKTLFYEVFLNDTKIASFRKYYNNLSEKEIIEIVNSILTKHNNDLEEAMNNIS